MGYHVINFFSKAYTLQYGERRDRKISSAGGLGFKLHYLRYMKENTKWCLEQKDQQQFIIFLTRTIVHPCIDVVVVKYVHGIPRSVCNRNQTKQASQRHPIYLTDPDHDYILDKVEHKEKIDYEIYISVDGDEE